MGLGPPVAFGRDADVFALGENRVLRHYRRGGDVTGEAAVMTYVAGLGSPVPEVFRAEGPDLEMERLPGPTLLAAVLRGGWDVEASAKVLAGLQRKLHLLPARLSTDPAARILHLDLHPDNVMLGPRGPVVIDWRNTAEGPPDLDLAMSALIVAQVALGDVPELAAIARVWLPAYLAEVTGQPLRQLDQALALRRADPAITNDEQRALGRAADEVRAVT